MSTQVKLMYGLITMLADVLTFVLILCRPYTRQRTLLTVASLEVVLVTRIVVACSVCNPYLVV